MEWVLMCKFPVRIIGTYRYMFTRSQINRDNNNNLLYVTRYYVTLRWNIIHDDQVEILTS